MIDAVEGRTEVKQAEQRHFLTIGGGVDVGQDAQERRLCWMVPPNADWRRGSRSCAWRYRTTWSATTLSTTLEMNVRFETGRKFFISALSSDGFFGSGVMIACFCDTGKQPSRNEALSVIVNEAKCELICDDSEAVKKFQDTG